MPSEPDPFRQSVHAPESRLVAVAAVEVRPSSALAKHASSWELTHLSFEHFGHIIDEEAPSSNLASSFIGLELS